MKEERKKKNKEEKKEHKQKLQSGAAQQNETRHCKSKVSNCKNQDSREKVVDLHLAPIYMFLESSSSEELGGSIW